MGLPDFRVNRLVAQQKATQIELDIASGNFDATLKKYKPLKSDRTATSNQGAKLFERFMIEQTKVKGLAPGSLRRYDCALKHLQKFFQEKAAETVNDTDAQAFVEYLRAKVSERTVEDYVILVQSCWVWAETTLPENPWPLVLKQVKPAPKQKVKPFTADEVQRILEGFRCDHHYKHHADFVVFPIWYRLSLWRSSSTKVEALCK
ncbi:Phage integrase, N-terminal SAM-like domain protein [Synechococcus sp. PCC 7335]|nr:Phage integrase, N-terminal SAM-like domain protein [Synechococcus sp. PCC 7335]